MWLKNNPKEQKGKGQGTEKIPKNWQSVQTLVRPESVVFLNPNFWALESSKSEGSVYMFLGIQYSPCQPDEEKHEKNT